MKKIFFIFAVLFILVGCSKKAEAKTTEEAVPQVELQPTDTEKDKYKFGNLESKIDIDFTRYNYLMADAKIFSMMMDEENYIGKKIKIEGRFYVQETDFGRFFLVLLSDETACCSTGFAFVDRTRRFPEDYPEQDAEIEVVGSYKKGYFNGTEMTYLDCN